MVNFLRLILLCLFCSSANADVPKIERYQGQYGSEWLALADTPQQACSLVVAKIMSNPGNMGSDGTLGYSVYVASKTACIVRRSDGAMLDFDIRSVNLCPANAVDAGSNCTCNAGFEEMGGQCVPSNGDGQCIANSTRNSAGECVCNSGFKQGAGTCEFDHKGACDTWEAVNWTIGGMLTGTEFALQGRVEDGAKFCNPVDWAGGPAEGGCRISFQQQMVATNHDGSITSYGKWQASPKPGTTDLSCTAGDGTAEGEPSKKPDQPKCPNGAPGTVNGVEVCIPRQPNNGVETGGKDSTTINDGTNTTKKENNNTTVCKDGKCTTTTVTTTTVTNNTSGAATVTTSTTTTDTSKGDFCAKNPSNAQCNGTGTGTGGGGGNGDGDGDKDPSKFGGACAAGFTCEGDAIQCAIAREQHIRSCKLYEDKSPESELYEQNKGKTGNQTNDLEGNETIDMQGRIDTSDALGFGSAGVQDLNITVMGQSITLPFSQLNKYLEILGSILVAISFLIALRIIGRG